MNRDPDESPSLGIPASTAGPPTAARVDPLDAAALAALDIEVLATATSTNAVLAARARSGGPGPTAIVAEHQTSGRGRLDRTWEAPPGRALTFSVLLRPEVAPVRWPWLPLLTGCVVTDVLRGLGYAAGVKWPNDVLLPAPVDGSAPPAHAKVAGILLERVETPAGPAAVVGVGLNVLLTGAELPVPTATSLALAGGTPPGRSALLAELVTRLRERHDRWAQEDPEVLRREFVDRCLTLGQQVRVDLPSAPALHGRAIGVDREGRLEVAGPHGVVAVSAGDVVHVRPDARPDAPDGSEVG